MCSVLAVLVVLAIVSAQPAAGAAQDAGTRAVLIRANAAYARAIELETQGNYAAALPLLWEAAGLAPRDADIQNRLGEALERMGALDAAVDAYRLAVSDRPAFRKASNNLMLALVKAGKGAEAIERARALVAAAPDDPDRHYTLGLAQSEQDVTAAIRTFRRVLELAPKHALARYNLALVLKRADRLPEALDELGQALAIEPRPEIHYTLGVIYWHQGDLDRAAAALRAAVAAQPRYADAHYTLGAILKARRDWTEAAASLRRAIALRPDLSASHYTLGQVLQLSGDDAGARDAVAEAERLRQRAQLEQEAGVWTVVGNQKLETGDLAAALEHFRHAIAVFEAYAPAHYQMGLALQRFGQLEAARAAFDRARQLNPGLVPPRDRQ
jgi:superkiller protein 3